MTNSLSWKTEKRKVSDLVPWDQNPRQMTEKQVDDLTESLKRLNLISIPAIDTKNCIVSGHQRVNILNALGRGDETIDVRVPSRPLTDAEFREANIRENKNVGEWDVDLLASFPVEELVGFGFDQKDLATMFGLKEFNFDAEDAENKKLEGIEDETINITVPLSHREAISEWLANGEEKTGPGMGRGVMKRCGLL